VDSGGPREPCVRCVSPDLPMGRDNFEKGNGHPIVKHRDTLRSAVRKWLNRLRCCLGCCLGWAQRILQEWCADLCVVRDNFERERAAHCEVYRRFAMSCAKTAEPIEVLCGLWTWVGPTRHLLDGGPDPLCEGAVIRVNGMPDNTHLP